MVDAPDLEAAVFVRVLRPRCEVAARGTDSDAERFEGREGDVLILRWADAKALVGRGDVELV